MVAKEERKWLITVGLAILLITTIPYLAGYFQQGDDWRFTGFLFGLEDGNSYIAKMLTGTYGSWLFRSPYSAMPQSGVVAFLPYILLGKLAYPPEVHDQLVVLFHIFRLMAGGFLIWITYVFCSMFIQKIAFRRLASLMILIGGGLGWTSLIVNQGNTGWGGSLEFYSPEAFGFLSLLGLPHLSMARGLLLLGFVYFWKSQEGDGRWGTVIKAGISWFFVGFFQPLTIVSGYGILGCYFLIRIIHAGKKEWRSVLPEIGRAAVMSLISAPWVLYNFLFFYSDTYLKAWYAQNIISSPPVLDYLLSYGLFLAVGIPALIIIFKGKQTKFYVLPAWIICAGILAYVPYNLQRRFIDGVWVALVLLIFISLARIQHEILRRVFGTILGLSFIAPVLVLMVMSIGILNPAEPVFRPGEEIKMVLALEKQVSPGDIVLTDYKTANSLPAWIPVRVIAGHGPESVHLKAQLSDVTSFFSENKDIAWQRDYLRQNKVRYIVVSPDMTNDRGWQMKAGLQVVEIYKNNKYRVYRVENNNVP